MTLSLSPPPPFSISPFLHLLSPPPPFSTSPFLDLHLSPPPPFSTFTFLHLHLSPPSPFSTDYFLVACNEISQIIYLFEQFNDIDSLINTFCHIVKQRLECDEIKYDILFLSCSCQITKSERKKVQRKHKSTTQKRLLDDKRKDEYAN